MEPKGIWVQSTFETHAFRRTLKSPGNIMRKPCKDFNRVGTKINFEFHFPRNHGVGRWGVVLYPPLNPIQASPGSMLLRTSVSMDNHGLHFVPFFLNHIKTHVYMHWGSDLTDLCPDIHHLLYSRAVNKMLYKIKIWSILSNTFSVKYWHQNFQGTQIGVVLLTVTKTLSGSTRLQSDGPCLESRM